MKCEVIQLRERGRRLRRREWPAPVPGDLRTSYLGAGISSFRCHTPELCLQQDIGPTAVRIALTLFFPELIEISAQGIVWRGLQLLAPQGEPATEFAQVWLVRPLA